MNDIKAKTLATVERERERERESISLLEVKVAYCNICKLNKKVISKKLKKDSNEKPVIDTG